MKIYPVRKSNHLTTDLIQEAKLWEDAYILSDFQSPWKDYIFSMEFSALYNKSHFFFQYKVYDTSIYIDNKDNKKANINNSDRVEIFFREDETLDPYYCLEINQIITEHIGPIAKLDKIQFTVGLPKTRSGKIMRRILRKIASNDAFNLGDISTLLNPEVVEQIIYGAE